MFISKKFYNVSFKSDQAKENRYIDKIVLKNEESYPITQSFHKTNQITTSHSTLEEQTKNQYQIMKFEMNVRFELKKKDIFCLKFNTFRWLTMNGILW